MKYLKQINDRYYQYIDKETKTVYSLKYGDRGIYGFGKAWYLNVIYFGIAEKTHIATFTVKSDGHRCEEEDYGRTLWTISQILPVANMMIGRMQNENEEE